SSELPMPALRVKRWARPGPGITERLRIIAEALRLYSSEFVLSIHIWEPIVKPPDATDPFRLRPLQLRYPACAGRARRKMDAARLARGLLWRAAFRRLRSRAWLRPRRPERPSEDAGGGQRARTPGLRRAGAASPLRLSVDDQGP